MCVSFFFLNECVFLLFLDEEGKIVDTSDKKKNKEKSKTEEEEEEKSKERKKKSKGRRRRKLSTN